MSRRELQYAAGWAAAIMALTCLPYFIVWFFLPRDGVFPGILFNADDHAVYLAWMRQAHDGQLLFRNLFTTEPQRGAYFHLYFLLLGWLARLPGVGLPLAEHLGRVFFGWLTLVLVYCLAARFTPEVAARRTVFWTTALGAGLGWLFWRNVEIQSSPAVDVWQPEAITFASLYTNGLFCVSLALMLGVVLCLLQAERGGWRWAAAAGACGLVLGNVHSYDVIHLTAVWGTYLVAKGGLERRFPGRELGYALVAAAVASPSVAYMAWLYFAEPVFNARANVPTLSPPLPHYLLGYGLLLPLAAWGAVLLWQRTAALRKAGEGDAASLLLPLCWAVAGLAVAYAPVAFQRKMVMGWHLPVALLAGLALFRLGQLVAGRAQPPGEAAAPDVQQGARGEAGGLGRVLESLAGLLRRVRPRLGPLAVGLAIALLSLSNVRYMERDLRLALEQNQSVTGIHPIYWPDATIAALEWIGGNTPPGAAVVTSPVTGALVPVYAARPVFAGHWGETPAYGEKWRPLIDFYTGRMTGAEREAFLRSNGIRYVLWGAKERELTARYGGTASPLGQDPFLEPVFSRGETVVYRVR